MKRIFGTGHRPDKLNGGWDNWQNHYKEMIEDFCIPILEEENPTIVISGMALGWDLVLAKSAILLKIPLLAYIPCKNQETKWRLEDQKEYRNILDSAFEFEIISQEYTNSCMQERNIKMVNDGDIGLALWNGSKGGTKNCIEYANKKGKPIKNLWKIYQELFV